MNSHKERGAFESVTEDAAAAAPAPLQSLSAGCPGLTGPGTRMRVEPRSMGAVLTQGGRVVIPLCQRPYCWAEAQVLRWWRDACGGGGTRGSNGGGGSSPGGAGTGKALFKTTPGGSSCA